jgi:Zn-dependent M28 family amino/carboxypeptidase
MAQRYIQNRFLEAGLEPPPGGFLQPFEFTNRRDTTQVVQGANVVAVASGTDPDPGTIVVTAHFDHLGIREPREAAAGEVVDSIYNGADDNASGTAALLSLGRYLAHHPLRHSVVLAAVDAEEMGLRGSRHFVEAGWPGTMVLNLNLDMLARTDSVLFAAGTYHYPQLLPPLEMVAGEAPLSLRFGHDRPGVEGQQDWTRSSDHHPFHQEGIPFVYFGVEDHPDYHRPTDEFERIDPGIFLDAVQTVLAALLALDQESLPGASSDSPLPR